MEEDEEDEKAIPKTASVGRGQKGAVIIEWLKLYTNYGSNFWSIHTRLWLEKYRKQKIGK